MTPRRARISGDLYHQQVPEGAVPVTRGRGPWGNPYKVGPGRSAAGVVALYRAYLDDDEAGADTQEREQ